jgi:hypothetical protein
MRDYKEIAQVSASAQWPRCRGEKEYLLLECARVAARDALPLEVDAEARRRYRKLQQRQRRLYERRMVFVSIAELESADRVDPLERRAAWVRVGNRVQISLWLALDGVLCFQPRLVP